MYVLCYAQYLNFGGIYLEKLELENGNKWQEYYSC